MSIRFKNLLKEKNPLHNVDDVKEDCQYFIQKNSDILENGFFLKRAVSFPYKGVTKKNPRERKKIFSPENFFFYEYFKPDEYKSREKLIPTYGGEVSRFFRGKDNVVVFPIGKNYGFYFHPNMLDFNYNRHLDATILNNPPHRDLIQKIDRSYKRYINYKIEGDDPNYKGKEYNIQDDEFETSFQYLSNLRSEVKDDMSPSEIRNIYSKVTKFIKKYERILKKNFDPILKFYKEYEQYFNDYFFPEFRKTQKLSKEMKNSEVGLFAPDGFYYIENKTIALNVIDDQ